MKKLLVSVIVSFVFVLGSQSVLSHHEPEGVLSHQDTEVTKKSTVKKPKPKMKTCGSDMVDCF